MSGGLFSYAFMCVFMSVGVLERAQWQVYLKI